MAGEAIQIMFQKLLSILHQYIQSGDTIIIGVSGGPDSVFLLHAMREFSLNTSCEIIIAHVNHGIRGRDSDNDEKFVKNLADRPSLSEAKKLMPRQGGATLKFELKFESKRVKLAGKSALEEKGREIRREFFEHLRSKYHAKWILTAHTQDDNVETIIFNFLRGSGLGGLAGMKEKNGFYLKPLLEISKKEILAFLRAKKIKFCIDKTNADTKFRRNFIRMRLLPEMEKINSSLGETLLRNSKIFRELDGFIKLQARDFLKKHKKNDEIFPLKEYEKLPAALKTAVIQEAFIIATGSNYRLPYKKVQEIKQMLRRKIGNKKIICSGGGVFYLKKGSIYLQ